jgi:hypothetical protein
LVRLTELCCADCPDITEKMQQIIAARNKHN